MNSENWRVINRAIRWLLVAMTLGDVAMALVAQDASLPFTWSWFSFDLLTTVGLSFLMPLCFARPNYTGSILFGELWPLSGKWPVWVFWIGIQSIAFHATSAFRLALSQQAVDYNLVRTLIETIWLWLIYTGRFRVGAVRMHPIMAEEKRGPEFRNSNGIPAAVCISDVSQSFQCRRFSHRSTTG